MNRYLVVVGVSLWCIFYNCIINQFRSRGSVEDRVGRSQPGQSFLARQRQQTQQRRNQTRSVQSGGGGRQKKRSDSNSGAGGGGVGGLFRM